MADVDAIVVLVSFRCEPRAELRHRLGAREPLNDHAPWVFRSARSAREVALTLLNLRDEEELQSAAVLRAMPAVDDLWVAAEWSGGLVVEAGLLDALGHDGAGWQVRSELRELLILEPRRPEAAPSASSEGPHDAIYLETPSEFAAAVDSGLAATTIASVRAVSAAPERWFGRLADPSVGGAVALLMCAPDADGDPGQLRLQPPGCAYAVVGVLHAPVDPTASFAAGAIFEQDTARRAQNLIVAAPAVVEVPLGQFIPIILPAWCMNSSLPRPAGSAMRPTALSMPQLPSTQSAVWRRIDTATGRSR